MINPKKYCNDFSTKSILKSFFQIFWNRKRSAKKYFIVLFVLVVKNMQENNVYHVIKTKRVIAISFFIFF